MATEAEALVLRMSADLRRFEKEMARMRQTADKRLTEVERRAMQSDKRLSRVTGQMGRNMVANFRDGLKGMAPVLAGAFSTAAVLRYADSYTELQNRLKAAGLEGERLVKVEGALFEAANRNGVAIDAVAQLFQRASLSRDALGASDEQLIALTNGVTAALRVQGVSAQEASGPLLQLGQALGGGTVRAEELNSLLEGTPVLLQAAAAGSDRFKGNMNALTKAVREGTVSSQELFQALLRGLPELEKQAAKMPPTVAQAFTTLNNELGRYVGQTDQGLSATERMAQGIVLLSNNLDTVVQVIAVFAALVGTKAALAMGAYTASLIANATAAVRLAAFQTAMTASLTGSTSAAVVATGAFARLNAAISANPIGLAIVATAALSAGLIYLAHQSDDARKYQEELSAKVAEADKVTGEYAKALADAATKTGKEREEALKLAAAIRETSRARIDDIRLTAQQRIADVEAARVRESEAYGRVQRDRSRGPRRDPNAEVNTLELSAARQNRQVAEAAASAAVRAQIKAEQALRSADQGTDPATGNGGSGGGASAGRSARDTESAREMLDLERDILAARASGDQAAIEAAEERLLLAQTIQKYERAGYADAEARAREEIGWLNEIEGLEERRAAMADLLSTYRENDVRRAQEATERAREENDILMDQLDLEAELARLRGDPAGVANAERRYFIERETNRILSQRKDITEEQARAEATGRYDQLRAADIIGGLGRDDPAAQAAALYEEVDRLRQEDLLSEEEAAQRRAQINAEYNEARLQDTRSMLDSLAGLQNSSNKKLAAIGKAAAITQATIDGYLAVQKALASAPPPFNFVQAAIVGAAAAANVASIAGMKDGGIVTGVGGPREDNQIRALSVGEFVNDADSTRVNRPWLEAMNNGARFEDLAARFNGMANGGLVGQVARLSSVSARPVGGSSLTYAPTLDARGADLGVVRRLERLMAEQSAQLEGKVTDIVSRREQYRLGSGRKGRRA